MGRKLISEEEAERIEREELAQERMAKFKEICPPNYRESDPERLDSESFRRVTDWAYNPTGLLIMGYTGTGKTRSIWQLMKQLMLQGHNPTLIKATALQRGIYEAYMKISKETVSAVISKYKFTKILIIDDFGKEQITPHYVAYLYEIIDFRRESGKPTIITTNLSSAQLEKKIGDGTISVPLIERIQEMCDKIEFKVQEK